MEHNTGNHFASACSGVVSLFFSYLTVFNVVHLQIALACGSFFIAATTAYFTVRYYRLAAKREKQQMKINEQIIAMNNKTLNN